MGKDRLGVEREIDYVPEIAMFTTWAVLFQGKVRMQSNLSDDG